MTHLQQIIGDTLDDSVVALEAAMAKEPQIQLETDIQLINGMCVRTIRIPAGTTLVGCRHKTDHINIMQGDIEVLTDNGMIRLTGYHVIPTKSGMKRAGYAHADTIWSTICKTEKTDLAEIEADLVETPELLQTRQLLAESSNLLSR